MTRNAFRIVLAYLIDAWSSGDSGSELKITHA